MFKWCFYLYDNLWRRLHRVQKVDSLISLSFAPHSGARRQLGDGTWIEPGDPLAILHFNHHCFINAGGASSNGLRAALRFRRLLFGSLRQLARRIDQDDRMRNIKAFYGITWFRPHGKKVGFMVERLPDSSPTRWRSLHFRLLLRAFFPLLARRENGRLHPHAFWMTRRQLLRHFR